MRLAFFLRRNGTQVARDFPSTCTIEVRRSHQEGTLSVREVAPDRFEVHAGSPSLSERHLQLVLKDGVVELLDGSSNGTFLRLPRGVRFTAEAPELSLAGELLLRASSITNEPALSATTVAELKAQLEVGLREMGFEGTLHVGRAPLARPAQAIPLGGEAFVWLDWRRGTVSDRIERWVRHMVSLFHLNAAPSSFGPLPEGFSFQAASAERKAALELARRVAASMANLPVLFLGRGGAGKERLARAVCAAARAFASPVLHLDIAGVAQGRLEVEIFGTQDTPGLLERAHGGTLILSAVEELTSSAQARLVAFLEKGVFHGAEGTKERLASVRIFALAQPSLLDRHEQGSFRSDLYYRLARVVIRVPRPGPEDVREIVREELRWGEEGPLPEDEVEQVAQAAAALIWKGGARELNEALARYLSIFRDPTEPRESFLLSVKNALPDASISPSSPASTGRLPFDPTQIGATCDALFSLHVLLAARNTPDVRALGALFNKSHQWARDQLALVGLTSRDLRAPVRLDACISDLRARLSEAIPGLQQVVQSRPTES